MSTAPQYKFGFTHQYQSTAPNLLDYMTWGGQSFLLIVMIGIFFFHIASKRKEVLKKPERNDFSLYTLKYISVFSTLYGFSIFLYSTKQILLKIGVAGANFGAAAGPLSYALTPLLFGFFNATLGFLFYFFARWRILRALESHKS